MTEQQPYASFHRAYLVAIGQDAKIVGVVRKEGPAWTVLRLGLPQDQQPTDRFVTRQEAAEYLVQLNPEPALRLGRQ